MSASSFTYGDFLHSSSGKNRAIGSLKGIHALLIENEPRVLSFLSKLLSVESCIVTACSNGADAIHKLQHNCHPDVVLIDAFLPGLDGLSTLAQIRKLCPPLPVIMLSCSYDAQCIVEAIKLGAIDVLMKPFDEQQLKAAILRGVTGVRDGGGPGGEHKIQLSENTWFVCSSKAMEEIHLQCTTIARVDLPVLILGESGSGKEILAQHLHKMSPRAHRTFLKVNCAAMPADLLESELFGYEQGAFTGAVRSKPGKFEICNNGTILLDEIGEMPPLLQAKLLQVLQDGSFARLGSRTTVQVDVRVIAATNVDIKAAIAEHRFREDLYYRLNGFLLRLPPLRERREEIPLFIRHFVQKLSGKYAQQPITFSDRLLQACMQHAWPGNLRELENFVKRYLVLGNEQLMLDELSAGRPTRRVLPVDSYSNSVGGLKNIVHSVKGEAETDAISASLEQHKWNRKRVAEELQISYKALLYKIREYGITPPSRGVGNKS